MQESGKLILKCTKKTLHRRGKMASEKVESPDFSFIEIKMLLMN